MNALDFVYQNAEKAVLELGYDRFVAKEAADHVQLMYRRNSLKKAGTFAADAIEFAKKHYPKPR